MAEEVKEAPVTEGEEQQAPVAVEEKRQVPLEALEAERSKRQEAEMRARMAEEYAARVQQKPKEEYDPEDVVTEGKYRESQMELRAQLKREVLEEAFCEMNPQAVQEINSVLPDLIKNKPWVKEVIEKAPNRWSRAHELVRDLGPKPQAQATAKRIEENAKKPASPVAVGKAAAHSKVDLLRSMAGKKEFREYRKKVLQGEA
jgi:hypothetical protein